MLTAIILILIITLLVLVHEFGHFWVAKKTGVRVEEFGLGLPPRAIGKKIGETIYSINWLPFGGFVKLTGEDFDPTDDPVPANDPRNFKSKTPLQRGAILIAGVTMNIFLAVFVYFVMFFMTNFKTMSLPLYFDYNFRFGNVNSFNTVVAGFSEDSSSKRIMEIGEAIIEIDGIPVYDVKGVREALEGKVNQEVSVLLMDVKGLNREFRTVKVIPNSYDGEVLFGVYLTKAFSLDYSNNKVLSGFMHTYNMMAYSASTLGNLFGQAFKSKDLSVVSSSVSGPVGVSQALSGILQFAGKEKLIGILDLIALLSISLAFLNILPFPALDGGRLIFVILEIIRGKKVSSKIEGFIHRWGMLFLILLLVAITVKDIRSLF